MEEFRIRYQNSGMNFGIILPPEICLLNSQKLTNMKMVL